MRFRDDNFGLARVGEGWRVSEGEYLNIFRNIDLVSTVQDRRDVI